METILLLGASADQLFAIKTAKLMGVKTVCVDMNSSSPGFSLADEYAVVSTRDIGSLKAFVDNYNRNHRDKISGVTVMGSDIPHVVSELAEYLGVPGIPLKSALLAVNKYDMKKQFQSQGVPIPWFKKISKVDELHEIVRTRGYPLVIKPTDRSGARGVFLLNGTEKADDLFEWSKSISFSGEVIVEEYLSGPQISTETVVYKGKAYTVGFADRNYEMIHAFAPNIIENGGTVPSILTQSQRQEVERIVEKTARALGITHGVVKGDIVVGEKGVFVIEMAARLSGGDFSESLIPLGTGVNIVEAAIKIALGKEVDTDALSPKWNKAVANRYFFPTPGKLLAIEGASISGQPWIKKLEFWYKIGDMVPRINSHADRFGVFVVTADSRGELQERIKRVYGSINIVTAP